MYTMSVTVSNYYIKLVRNNPFDIPRKGCLYFISNIPTMLFEIIFRPIQ